MTTQPLVTTPDLDPADPYAREAQTFPRLNHEMAAPVAGYGMEERLAQGTLVSERGERSADFFFVLEGTIEIFELGKHGEPNVFRIHTKRQFTGELDLFNDRQILVSGRTGAGVRIVRVKRADFRPMVAAEPDIGEYGDRFLRQVTWTNRDTGENETHPIANVFVMIGAKPNTEWLDGCLDLDPRGFVRTGQETDGQALASPFATKRPGIYAVGDVRLGSVNRVASSVCEGSVVVQAIHRS